jgi:hypothetical protein
MGPPIEYLDFLKSPKAREVGERIINKMKEYVEVFTFNLIGPEVSLTI